MKLVVLLLLSCVTAVIASVSTAESPHRSQDDHLLQHLDNRHNPPNPAPNGTCSIVRSEVNFRVWVDDLTITGQVCGDADLNQSILMDITVGGAVLVQFSSQLLFAGPVSYKWHFGDMVGIIRDMTLTVNGNWTTGTVNGRDITPFSPQSSNLTFANGTFVPAPDLPPRLASALAKVPDALRSVFDNCQSSESTSSLVRQETAPRPFLDRFACTRCTFGVTGGLLICGLRCGMRLPIPGDPLPFPCGCIPGPIIIHSCTRLGLCCPVACGDAETIPSIGVVRRPARCCAADAVCFLGRCCPSGQFRRNICCSDLLGVCCEPGTRPRCSADGTGIQTCAADGIWEFTPCLPTQRCYNITAFGCFP